MESNERLALFFAAGGEQQLTVLVTASGESELLAVLVIGTGMVNSDCWQFCHCKW